MKFMEDLWKSQFLVGIVFLALVGVSIYLVLQIFFSEVKVEKDNHYSDIYEKYQEVEQKDFYYPEPDYERHSKEYLSVKNENLESENRYLYDEIKELKSKIKSSKDNYEQNLADIQNNLEDKYIEYQKLAKEHTILDIKYNNLLSENKYSPLNTTDEEYHLYRHSPPARMFRDRANKEATEATHNIVYKYD